MKVYTLANLSHYQYLSAPHSILTERTTEYFAEEHTGHGILLNEHSRVFCTTGHCCGGRRGSEGLCGTQSGEGGEIEGEDEQRGLEGWYKTTTPMSEGNGKYFYEGLKGTVTAKV